MNQKAIRLFFHKMIPHMKRTTRVVLRIAVIIAILLIMIVSVQHLFRRDLELSIIGWESNYINYRMGGWYIDENVVETDETIDMIYSPSMWLDKGTYTVQIDYECENDQGYLVHGNSANAAYIDAGFNELRKDKKSISHDFVLEEDIADFEILIKYNGKGALHIKNICIKENRLGLLKEQVLLLLSFLKKQVVMLFGFLKEPLFMYYSLLKERLSTYYSLLRERFYMLFGEFLLLIILKFCLKYPGVLNKWDRMLGDFKQTLRKVYLLANEKSKFIRCINGLGGYMNQKTMMLASHLKGMNGVILSLYLFFVISVQIFISWPNESFLFFLIMELFVIAGVCVICPLIFIKISTLRIGLQENNFNKKEKILWISLFFMSTFSILFFRYLAYYPGAFMIDAINQCEQAIKGMYNDWHPVLQTLFTYTFPLTITGKIGSIILFQIIEFSIVVTYMAYTILQYSNKKYAICSLLYIILNPITGAMLLNPWKDTPFAMSVLLLMVFGLKIFLTRGEWIKLKNRRIIFILTLTAATLFRHNAILFTIPFLAVVIIHIHNKKIGRNIIIQFILLLMLIKIPVYGILNVIEPDNRQVEMLGLPMTMLGNVAKESPESFDEVTAEFMYSVAPKKDWENLYQCGNFNAIKWESDTNQSVIEETGVENVLSMTLRTLLKAPVPSLKGLFCLTDLVYAFDGNIIWDWGISIDIVENDLGIEPREIVGKDIVSMYDTIVKNSIFKYFFYYIGIINLILIASILVKYNLKDKYNWKKISFCLPILIYNFGTMLLLSGEDFRFFYLNFPICPILLMILYGEKKETGTFCKAEKEDSQHIAGIES